MTRHLARREFITLVGVAASWPVAVWAQQPDDRVRALLDRILRLQADYAADKIDQFIKEIKSQVGWTTQLPWSAGTFEQRRFDGLRLLRQVPGIVELRQLDSAGKEQLKVSRSVTDKFGGTDYSGDPKFTEAVAKGVYYGPVYFSSTGGSKPQPYMTLSLADGRLHRSHSQGREACRPASRTIDNVRAGDQY